MTRYVYLNNIRKSTVRLGISTKVFTFIANKALKNVNGILLEDDDSDVSIGLKNNVVVFKINACICRRRYQPAAPWDFPCGPSCGNGAAAAGCPPGMGSGWTPAGAARRPGPSG